MKKLFVSVPMKGRTEEEIKASIQKMKKIAEIYEGEELELIDSYIEDNPPKNSKEAMSDEESNAVNSYSSYVDE